MASERLSLTIVLFVIFVWTCSASSSNQNQTNKTTSTSELRETDNSSQVEESERGRNYSRRSDVFHHSSDKQYRSSVLPQLSSSPSNIPPRLQQFTHIPSRTYDYPSDSIPTLPRNPVPPRFRSTSSGNSPGLSKSGHTWDARFWRSSRIRSNPRGDVSSSALITSRLNPGAAVFVPAAQLERANISPAPENTLLIQSANAKKLSKRIEISGFPFEGFSESGNVAIGHDAREIEDDLPTNIFIAWKTNVKTYVIPPSKSFDESADEIKSILRDSVVVGYGLRKLFKKLNISHPNFAMRDLECLTKFCNFLINRPDPTFEDFFQFFYRKMTNRLDVEAVAQKSYRVYLRFQLEWEEEVENLIKLKNNNNIRGPIIGHAGFHCDDQYYPLDAIRVDKNVVAINVHSMKNKNHVTHSDMVDSSGNVLTRFRNLHIEAERNENWKKDLETAIGKVDAKVIVGFRVKSKLSKIFQIDENVKIVDLSELNKFSKYGSLIHMSKRILHMDYLIEEKQMDGIDRARLALQLYKVLLPNMDKLFL